jgi:Fic family protein
VHSQGSGLVDGDKHRLALKASPEEVLLDVLGHGLQPVVAGDLEGDPPGTGVRSWRLSTRRMRQQRTDAVLRAALAHLWFVTIHPFDDGNGRIARAIADWQLARSEKSAQRFYSMSAQIRIERKEYYDILERTQKGPLDVTPWMEWFLGCLGRAFDGTEATLEAVMRKARFWERLAQISINDRQRAILNRLLDGFEGKLTTTKWAKLGKCSHDTALRDIREFMGHGILQQDPGGGRSTSYSLVE